MYRRAILVALTVLISVSALFGVFPKTAYADAPSPYLAPSILSDAKTMGLAESLAICMEYNSGYEIDGWSGSHSELTPEKVVSGKWFRDTSGLFTKDTQYRMWNSYQSGGVDCHGFDVNSALKAIGWTSNVQAVCDLGMTRENKSNCVSGDGNFQWNNANKQDTINNIFKVYKGGYFDANKDYVRAMDMLQQAKVCKINLIASVATATPDQKAAAGGSTIDIVGADGTITKTYYSLGASAHSAWGYNNQGSENYIDDKDCNFLVDKVNSNSGTYSTWVKQNQPGSANNAGTCEQYATLQTHDSNGDQAYHDKLLKACQDGQTNKSDAGFCDKTYPPQSVDSPSGVHPQATPENAACAYGRDKASSTGSTTDPTGTDSKPTCGIQGIGWLVCPVMDFLAKVNDAAYNFLASYFLSVDTTLLGDQTKAAWSSFRDIANVAFVIAILFIVYSQVTSMGISNYGIKRMLPRLIVAALLVNISFYICAAAVDISNLLGYAIPQFFTNIPIGAGLKDGSTVTNLGAQLTWTIVIGAALLAAAVGVMLAVSVPVLLAALLAIALIVLMLVGRQAFIVLLIVVSPLAFVAYLLPNTEQWFKKWYKAFFALLMLFPIIGTVFGASRMAALIIANAGGGSDAPITQLVALGVSVIPFFVVPSLLKGSLAAAGTLGTKLQGMANKAGGRVGSRVKDSSYAGAYMAQRKKLKATDRAQSYGKGLKGRISNSRFSGRAGSHLASTGLALASKEESEAVDHEMVAMQKQSGWTEANRLDKAQEEFVSAMKKGDTTRARAAQKILLSGGNKGISNLQNGFSELGQMDSAAYGSMMNSPTGQKVMSDLSSSGIKGKNAALNQLSYTKPVDDNGNKNTVDSIANKGSTYTALNDNELAGQSEDNLRAAVTNGGISAERAQRIQGNDTVWSQLSEDKKQIISQVAGGAPAPSTSAQAPTQGGTPSGGSPTQLNIPHGGAAPSSPSPTSPPSGAAPHASTAHTPPGTSNYQQRPNGLWVPPGAGGGNPPSTP